MKTSYLSLAVTLLLLVACGHASPAPVSELAQAVQMPSHTEPESTSLPTSWPDEVWPAPVRQYGTAHPLIVQQAGRSGRWVAACQAREDTDGDGEIAVHFGHHGEVFGDQARLYLMHDGAPEGMPIEELVAVDSQGRFVAYQQGGRISRTTSWRTLGRRSRRAVRTRSPVVRFTSLVTGVICSSFALRVRLSSLSSHHSRAHSRPF